MTSSFHIDWKAATWAGIIAGMVFLLLEMIMVPVFGGGSPWGPPRMMAAIVLGEGVLPPPATFDAVIVMAAMGLHLVLSIAYAVMFALVVNRLNFGPALALGAVGGLILYLVNFYGFTALFPWFAMARNWISIFGHVVFGLAAAGTYLAIRQHHVRAEAQEHAPLREKKA